MKFLKRLRFVADDEGLFRVRCSQAVTDDELFTYSDSDVTEIVTYSCDGSESALSQCQQLTVASSCVVCMLNQSVKIIS